MAYVSEAIFGILALTYYNWDMDTRPLGGTLCLMSRMPYSLFWPLHTIIGMWTQGLLEGHHALCLRTSEAIFAIQALTHYNWD